MLENVIKSDAEGYIIFDTGSVIGGMYEMVKELGKGEFGSVILVHSTKTKQKLALKVIRNIDEYREDGIAEIMALKTISSKDPKDTRFCNKLISSFEYNGHICMTFKALGQNVLQFLEDNHYNPFPLKDVRHISYQLCHAVDFLHRNGIAHTDIKPDNVLFVDSTSKMYNCDKSGRKIRLLNHTDIRLIDFGSTMRDEEEHCFTVTNRYYRAPEIVLKMEWSKIVDVWSIGCILYDLCAGDPDVLFNTEDDDLQHLAVMEKRLGAIPRTMANNKRYFTDGKLNYDTTKSDMLNSLRPLKECIPNDGDSAQVWDLMKQMLTYEPWERNTLDVALRHPFFEQLPAHQRVLP